MVDGITLLGWLRISAALIQNVDGMITTLHGVPQVSRWADAHVDQSLTWPLAEQLPRANSDRLE